VECSLSCRCTDAVAADCMEPVTTAISPLVCAEHCRRMPSISPPAPIPRDICPCAPTYAALQRYKLHLKAKFETRRSICTSSKGILPEKDGESFMGSRLRNRARIHAMGHTGFNLHSPAVSFSPRGTSNTELKSIPLRSRNGESSAPRGSGKQVAFESSKL
jgi:hypothetical protein